MLRGPGFYDCQDGGIVYEVGPRTFVQVNDNVRGKLYERALSFAAEEDTVIDCYAGGGLLTAKFAGKCRRAYGIEVVPEAHACAQKLRADNALEGKMENLCGRVEDLLPDVLERARDALIVLDPPRAGVAREVLDLLMEKGVQRIVMISCDPATLARDLGILTGALVEQGGALVKAETPSGPYTIVTAEPFDMFPQTRHVETLICLERK